MAFQLNTSMQPGLQQQVPGPLSQMGQVLDLAGMVQRTKMGQFQMQDIMRQRAANLALGQEFARQLTGSPAVTGQSITGNVPGPTAGGGIPQAGNAPTLAGPAPTAVTQPTTKTPQIPVFNYDISDEDKQGAANIFNKFGFDAGMKSWNMLVGEKTRRLELGLKAAELGKNTSEIEKNMADTSIKKLQFTKDNYAPVAQQLNAMFMPGTDEKGQPLPPDPSKYSQIVAEARSRGIGPDKLPDQYDPSTAHNFIAMSMDLSQQHSNLMAEKELFMRQQQWSADKFLKWTDIRAKLNTELTPYKQSRDAWNRVNEMYNPDPNTGNHTGARDMALLVNFARLQNPSQSRQQIEASLDAGRQIGSLPQQVVAFWQNLKSGAILDKRVRDQIYNASKHLYDVLNKSSQASIDQYEIQAKKAGIEDPKSITAGIWEPETAETPTIAGYKITHIGN